MTNRGNAWPRIPPLPVLARFNLLVRGKPGFTQSLVLAAVTRSVALSSAQRNARPGRMPLSGQVAPMLDI